MLTLLHLLSAVALLVGHAYRAYRVMRVYGARLRTVLSSSVEKAARLLRGSWRDCAGAKQ